MSINLDTFNSLPPDVQQVLVDLGKDYSKGVAAELGVRYDKALESIPQDLASYYGIFPVAKIGNVLTIAVSNPNDVLKLYQEEPVELPPWAPMNEMFK